MLDKAQALYIFREVYGIRTSAHDDAIWKRFPNYRPFVGEIRRSPADSPHNWPAMLAFDFSFDPNQNKRLNKQSMDRWFGTPWRSCGVNGISLLVC